MELGLGDWCLLALHETWLSFSCCLKVQLSWLAGEDGAGSLTPGWPSVLLLYSGCRIPLGQIWSFLPTAGWVLLMYIKDQRRQSRNICPLSNNDNSYCFAMVWYKSKYYIISIITINERPWFKISLIRYDIDIIFSDTYWATKSWRANVPFPPLWQKTNYNYGYIHQKVFTHLVDFKSKMHR